MTPELKIVEVGNGWFYFKINNDDGTMMMQEYYHDTPEEKEIGQKAILKRYDDRVKEEAREREKAAKAACVCPQQT